MGIPNKTKPVMALKYHSRVCTFLIKGKVRLEVEQREEEEEEEEEEEVEVKEHQLVTRYWFPLSDWQLVFKCQEVSAVV